MQRPRRALLLVAALCVAACGNAARPTVPGAQLPLEWLVVGTHRISVEVASGPAERNRGLMFRESLPADHGMLFIFPDERLLTFWMRNTSLPLSIAYADAGGRIVRISDLEPLDEHPVSSGRPARYALEMRRGWFREHAVFEGDRITGIPQVAAK
jgi:uncharacterized protein